MSNTKDLPSELLAARDRVRDVVLPSYVSIGPARKFALEFVVKPALRKAEAALKNHDAFEMLEALEELKGIK